MKPHVAPVKLQRSSNEAPMKLQWSPSEAPVEHQWSRNATAVKPQWSPFGEARRIFNPNTHENIWHLEAHTEHRTWNSLKGVGYNESISFVCHPNHFFWLWIYVYICALSFFICWCQKTSTVLQAGVWFRSFSGKSALPAETSTRFFVLWISEYFGLRRPHNLIRSNKASNVLRVGVLKTKNFREKCNVFQK